MFVLALKQPEVSKPSLQPDSALDTDDGITQGTDADAGCPSAFDEEDDIAVADCGLDDEFESWMDQISLDINDRQDYKPFPSKMFALLFFLVHGPHPIGNRTLMFIWFILNQTGISVPSLKAVRSFKLPGLDLPKRHVSSQGNPFYCQSVVSTLQLCMANPKIASSLTRYPVQTEGAVEEIYLGSVWNDDERFQAPMAALPNGEHIFVRDCITFEHHSLGTTKAVIVKFFEKNTLQGVHAKVELLLNCYQYQYVTENTNCYLPDDCCVIYGAQVIHFTSIIGVANPPLSVIKWTEAGIQRFSNEEKMQYFASNEWKEKAGEKKVIMVPLILFTDDTSGNRSKKWNKFESWYLLLAGLGRHANAKPSNIHFLTTSNKVSPLDQSVPIVEELLLLESEGIEAYDAFSDCQVLVVAPLICVICDNPRAKELCNQLASSTRKYCRICMADKIDSPDFIGVPRTRALSLSQMEEISSQTSISRTYNTRKKYGIKEHYNPMLHTNIRADIYKATPLEALHVFALGASKYFLQLFMPDFTHDQKTEILALIKAFNMSGFTTKMYGNVCYYYNSFVGRDFKAWSQMAIFILSPYLDAGRKEVLLNYSKVFAIAYAKSYNRHLKEQWKSVCQNFIDSVKVHFPNLLRRPKMHLILHLIECLEQYGPTSAFSAERCESFNSDVRAQNIYSNRQAPSRDIGKHFAVLEHVRHIIDGGRYGQESVGALTVSVPGMEKCTLFGLAQHDPPYVLSFHHVQLNDKVTTECRGIVAQSFQLLHTGDYVELDVPCELKFGVLLSVCKLAVGSTVCFIQMFEPMFIRIGEPLLSDTDCPMFELSRNIEAVEGCKVLKAVSFVHDCFSEGCHFEEMVLQSRPQALHSSWNVVLGVISAAASLPRYIVYTSIT
ncbi:hypothetical protein EMCRGX_G008563 [Ephydatia muelleri]